MACKNAVEDLDSKPSKLDHKSSFKEELTIANWNVHGPALAEHRKAVTFPTTKGLQADIVCLQEMPVTHGGKVFKTYVAYDIDDTYVVEETSEGNRKYNTLLYKKERFTPDEAWTTHSDQAFALMEVKLEAYKDIRRVEQKQVDWKIKELPQKTLERLKKKKAFPGIKDNLLDRCIQEALREYERIGNIDEILQRYVPPTSTERKTPKECLERRVAMVLLKTEPAKIPILVISFHSYRIGENLNYLLFEFLEMLAVSGHNYPVLVAGDFNQDIRQAAGWDPTPAKKSPKKSPKPPSPLVHVLVPDRYDVPKYNLTPLRDGHGLGRIDFILLRRPAEHDRYTFRLSGTKAIEFDVQKKIEKDLDGKDRLEKHRTITNHSPLIATLKIQKVDEKTEHK